MSNVYSARISDPQLLAAISEYASDHRVGEGTALGRLALEGLKAAEGKPITRFALLDPAAQTEYSLALNELRCIHKALHKTFKALGKTRPLDSDSIAAWERDVDTARAALEVIPIAMSKLRGAGRLQAVLLNSDYKEFEKLYSSENNRIKFPSMTALLGALLGKPVEAQSKAAEKK